jgi:hypothetical protein
MHGGVGDLRGSRRNVRDKQNVNLKDLHLIWIIISPFINFYFLMRATKNKIKSMKAKEKLYLL